MSYYRPIRTHANLQDLFAKAQRQSSGCIEWQGATDGHNYGQLRVDGKNRLVHRLVCDLIYGTPLTKQNALHSCDNSLCINLACCLVVASQRAFPSREATDSSDL